MANLPLGKVGSVSNAVLMLFRLAYHCQIVIYLFETTKLTVLT